MPEDRPPLGRTPQPPGAAQASIQLLPARSQEPQAEQAAVEISIPREAGLQEPTQIRQGAYPLLEDLLFWAEADRATAAQAPRPEVTAGLERVVEQQQEQTPVARPELVGTAS